ncbi:hypothetical protein DI458_24940 [Burkholderia contaminans]|nr:hypothetical protein [Burkholderia contaminans]MBA9840756.1 hypothetical protein [Burkholderia contaminans]MBA9866061.1 hypothetical protein [Burkholderia contaminans]MBA9907896.1 hypothetical protein [Burkholderia contaminans]MBA9931451.1 hypothetical protein [Burkholderia contaminans]
MPAVAGAGGIDATSLGFGRQTKHPARRQAPLSHVQHCAGDRSRGAFCRMRQQAARCWPACGGCSVSGRHASGLSPLVQAPCAS